MSGERIINGLKEALASMEAVRPIMTGQIALVSDDEFVTDKKRGITYVTQPTWDRLKAAIPNHPSVASPPAPQKQGRG